MVFMLPQKLLQCLPWVNCVFLVGGRCLIRGKRNSNADFHGRHVLFLIWYNTLFLIHIFRLVLDERWLNTISYDRLRDLFSEEWKFLWKICFYWLICSFIFIFLFFFKYFIFYFIFRCLVGEFGFMWRTKSPFIRNIFEDRSKKFFFFFFQVTNATEIK